MLLGTRRTEKLAFGFSRWTYRRGLAPEGGQGGVSKKVSQDLPKHSKEAKKRDFAQQFRRKNKNQSVMERAVSDLTATLDMAQMSNTTAVLPPVTVTSAPDENWVTLSMRCFLPSPKVKPRPMQHHRCSADGGEAG